MAVNHVDKPLALGLVKDVGESNYQSLLSEAWHIHHSMVEVTIYMSWAYLSKGISHIVDTSVMLVIMRTSSSLK